MFQENKPRTVTDDKTSFTVWFSFFERIKFELPSKICNILNKSLITANKNLLDSKYFQAEKRGDWYLVSGKYFERVLWFNGYENPITMRRF